jgi:hypothetical protein
LALADSLNGGPKVDLSPVPSRLDPKPHPTGDYIPLEDIFPRLRVDENVVALSSLWSSARSGCKGCHVLATGAALFARNIDGRQVLKSIKLDNRGTHLSAKLIFEDEETTRKIFNDTVDRHQFEYYVGLGENVQ